MEESHHSARVKKEEEFLSILSHLQELSSPGEIFSVLLRRTVENYGFFSGWILSLDGGELKPIDEYPPLEAQKEESLTHILPPMESLMGVETLRHKDHLFVVVPLRSRKECLGVLVLKGDVPPAPQILRDLSALGVVAGGCIVKGRRDIQRIKSLGFLVKSERKGKGLLLLESLEEIKSQVQRDMRELVGCQGTLLAPVSYNRWALLGFKGEEMRALAQKAIETRCPVHCQGRVLFPLVSKGNPLGFLVVEGEEKLEGKRGGLEIYVSSLTQALQKVLDGAILKERYRGMVVSPLLGLFQLDEEGHISFVNTTLALTLGYPMKEARDLVGRPFHQLVHPSSRPLVVERLQAQLKGEERPRIHQITLADKEGSPVPMMVSTVPITLPGKGRGILGVAIDITEKERLLEDLSQRNKELESFAYSAAHELRGPIVYLKRVVAQPSLEDFPMEELKWAVNRLESTLKHLTAYSLMDNKEVELERISPYLLVESIWKDLAREVGITMDIAINLPPVIRTDPFLLELIFKNLLRNAFKYGIKGSPPLVEVGYARKRGELLFHVKDYGEGFPPDKAQEIFKPFVRLHASKKGTGLGLTIAKKAVEKLGGTIWAEGAPGKGATFYFTHPIF